MPGVHFEDGPTSLSGTGGFYSVSEASPSFAGLHSIGSNPAMGSSKNLTPVQGTTTSTLGGTLTRTGTASGTALLEGEEDPKREADFLLTHAVSPQLFTSYSAPSTIAPPRPGGSAEVLTNAWF